jgi:hypothetical protein
MRSRQTQKGGGISEMFIEACADGRLRLAKWIHRLNPFLRRLVYSNAFFWACCHGHLRVAQWLLQVKPEIINRSVDNQILFRFICYYGRLEVAQWLLQVKPNIDISASEEEAFRAACENGHLEVAQWLLQVKPTIDISVSYNYAFLHACEKRRLRVAQWLATLKPEYEIVNEDSPDWTCNVLTDPEAIKKKKNWNRRKTGLYLRSDLADTNILNVMPTDVAKIANSYLG